VSAAARLATLPRAARRALALAILSILLLLVWLLLLAPVEWLATSQDEWRAHVVQQIAGDRGTVRSANRIREVAGVVRDAPIRGRLYETGPMAVDDQLQNDLRAALLQSGVEPTTFKVLPGTSVKGLRQHRVEFSSVMSVDQLRALYGALQQQRHYVRIERLQIESPASQRADENPRLTLLMEAQGFALEAPAMPVMKVARAY
jgi:hypothetical protein